MNVVCVSEWAAGGLFSVNPALRPMELGLAGDPSYRRTWKSRCVWADERQLEPWPRDRGSAGIVAPAQLEQIVSGLDHDGFPPRRPSALRFGQHEMADIDVVPIFGQRLGVGGEFCRDGFIVFCLA